MVGSKLMDDEIRYRLLKHIEENPEQSQRELAKAMGISLGKTNFCIKALVDVGFIKVVNFAKSSNKLKYAYVLTPQGLSEKAAVTVRFLKAKQRQYEQLEKEIADLKQETPRQS